MLIACERCKRHFSIREDVCPFCKQGSAFARIGAAALSAGMLLSGCDAGKDSKTPRGSAAQVPYAAVRGTVKNSAGAPLNGASVMILVSDPTASVMLQKTVKTDVNGRFALDFIDPGSYQLTVSYSNYENGRSVDGYDTRGLVLIAGAEMKLEITVQARDTVNAMPYGAPPARRRVV